MNCKNKIDYLINLLNIINSNHENIKLTSKIGYLQHHSSSAVVVSVVHLHISDNDTVNLN